MQPELLELLYPLFVHCYLELLRSRKPELAPALFARFAPEHEAPHGHDLLQLAALRTGEQERRRSRSSFSAHFCACEATCERASAR